MTAYPDSRPKFPLSLASLKPSLQQLVMDPLRPELYAMAKEQGGSVIKRYDIESGLTTPIISTKGIGNSIGYGGQCYDAYNGQLAAATSEKQIALLSTDGASFKPITPKYEGIAAPRFVPFAIDSEHQKSWLVFVAKYTVAGEGERQQVMICDGASQPIPLSEPSWFAFDPVVSPDGRWLAWQQWQSHEMPFISSTLVVARLDWQQGRPQLAAGGTDGESCYTIAHSSSSGAPASVSYPAFSPDGNALAYCSDHEGRRQIYLLPLDRSKPEHAISIGEGEVGDPSWVYGQQPFRFLADSRIVWRHSLGLSDKVMLSTVDSNTGVTESKVIFEDQSAIGELQASPYGWSCISERTDLEPQVLLASSAHNTPLPILTSKRGGYRRDLLIESQRLPLTFAEGFSSEGLYLPPRRQANVAKYPLIVFIHGGPTARVTERFRADWQYLASRGIAILAINHRGSGGHGRKFQDQLAGEWGVVDVADAKAAAEQAVAHYDELDAKRLYIMGGSAGGYTTLQALVTDRDFWAGGICLYGIADQIKLAETTHPFERPYNPYLLGGNDEKLWRQRSPRFAEPPISSPVLLFHGGKDKAVPIEPIEDFYDHLITSGNREAYLTVFPEEGHGFRRSDSIETLLTEILDFIT